MKYDGIDLQYIIRSIDLFIDEICTVQLSPNYIGSRFKDKYKNIVILLEEAKINCQHNRYVNFHDIEKIISDFGELASCGIWVDLKMFSEHIDRNFDYFLQNEMRLLNERKKLVDDSKHYIELLIEQLSDYPDLYGDAVNYFLHYGSFTDLELVEVNGVSIKTLIEKNGFNIFSASLRMMDLKWQFRV